MGKLFMVLVAIFAIAPIYSATMPVPPTFTQTNLVADVAGNAKTTDSNLVNPWGMALGTNSGIWVSVNGSGISKSFDGTGQALPSTAPCQRKIEMSYSQQSRNVRF
jgi:hypothetical protein